MGGNSAGATLFPKPEFPDTNPVLISLNGAPRIKSQIWPQGKRGCRDGFVLQARKRRGCGAVLEPELPDAGLPLSCQGLGVLSCSPPGTFLEHLRSPTNWQAEGIPDPPCCAQALLPTHPEYYFQAELTLETEGSDRKDGNKSTYPRAAALASRTPPLPDYDHHPNAPFLPTRPNSHEGSWRGQWEGILA